MKRINTESILDEAGIEMLVTYEYTEESQIEDFHGRQEISYVDVVITNIELIVSGHTFNMEGKYNLLPYLNEKQLKEITSQLEIY